MNLNFNISDEKLDKVSTEGKNELTTLSKKFVENVLDEASRIEATNKSSSGNPEITATIIKDAHDYVRKFNIKAKTEQWIIVVQIVAYLATLLTGVALKKADFTQTEELLGFLFLFFLSSASSVILIFKEIRK